MKVLVDPRVPTSKPVNVRLARARLRMMEENVAFFAEEALGLTIAEHHIEWAREVRAAYDVGQHISLMAARGHGKSGFFAHGYVLWQMWRAEGTLGLVFSATDSQVAELFRLLKYGKVFADPDTGHTFKLPAANEVADFEGLIPKDYSRAWNGQKIMFTNGSRTESRTFGKESRGRHVHWILCDDIQKREVQYSEVMRTKARDTYERDVEPMVLPGGLLVNVGTPLHADDLFGRQRKNPEYRFLEYAAYRKDPETGDDVPLWPEFRNAEYLAKKKRSMGSLAFAQEYLLRPATSETSIFPRELVESVYVPGLAMRPRRESLGDVAIFAGVDFAISASVGADYTVIVVIAVDSNGNRTVLDLIRGKGLPFQRQLAMIEEMDARYGCDLILLEANQMQRIFTDELIRTSDMPVKPFTTTAGGKNSFEYGVPALRTLMENGKWRFPTGDAYSQERVEILTEELAAFVFTDDKLQGVGAHDDTVMALWLADRAARAGGGLVALLGDGDGDLDAETRLTLEEPGGVARGGGLWGAPRVGGSAPRTIEAEPERRPKRDERMNEAREMLGLDTDDDGDDDIAAALSVDPMDTKPAFESVAWPADVAPEVREAYNLAPPSRSAWIEAFNEIGRGAGAPAWAGTIRAEDVETAMRGLLGML